MKRLENRQDIEFLINEFYKKVTKDALIGHFFTEVIQLDWKVHIPIMYDFWESILFGAMKYKGNPMVKHIELSRKSKILPKHFDQWLALWEETVQLHFQGEKAQEAIQKSKQIGGLMQFKVEQNS